MRARLARLGVDGVEARTFHSAALSQLVRARGEAPGKILSTKALLLRQIGNTLPPPYKFRPAADLATEVEWAKNRRLTPESYRCGLDGHEPPIPADLMARVFSQYEQRKSGAGLIDFEDLLEACVRMYEEDEWAVAALRERFRAFTVDEYQDVNLLQQSLLQLWLGPRRGGLRGRRRLPVDLRVHRRVAGVAARARAAVPGGDGRPAGGELPLLAAGARAREPARAAARRRGEDAACDARGRAGAGAAWLRFARGGRRSSCSRACASWRPRACRTRRWRCSSA